MIVAVIAACSAASFFALVFSVFGFRSDASRRVAELDWTKTEKAGNNQSKMVTRILSSVDKSAVGARLAEAGWYKTTVSRFVLSRFAGSAIGASIGAVLTIALSQTQVLLLAALGVGTIGFMAPSFIIDSGIKKRKDAIARRVPDLLDMVSTTVEAGTALNSALATAAGSFEGPLAEEINIVLSDIRLGRSRADAFNAMSQRAKQVDLSAMVTTIVQTERLGGNIGSVLDELAQEARARRLSRAEEIAAKLPVLMILPMVFFMLPALFVMIFTPVVAQFIGSK